ncbi:hypothetical protein [Pseudarthrobacter sp. NamE5]|uniref:hypothetical protein n=1 Tax=Pseudarthrobacter sp. NamE5 TaxID=2576839 RepID=UPI00110B49B2|nr:hypothetical protein [Pseudarthrobacter sp. NamE5]TLM88208.1 hypothetical protein FDW84_01430 [Pseudarthrobacter sp. NamE5]
MNGHDLARHVPVRLGHGQHAVFPALTVEDAVKVGALAALRGQDLNELACRFPVIRVLWASTSSTVGTTSPRLYP